MFNSDARRQPDCILDAAVVGSHCFCHTHALIRYLYPDYHIRLLERFYVSVASFCEVLLQQITPRSMQAFPLSLSGARLLFLSTIDLRVNEVCK